MIITGLGCDVRTVSEVAKMAIIAQRFRHLGKMSRHTDLY